MRANVNVYKCSFKGYINNSSGNNHTENIITILSVI